MCVGGGGGKVRQDIGVCPQHDALMPLLTAREHIEMYMDLKGMRQELKGCVTTGRVGKRPSWVWVCDVVPVCIF